MDARTLALINQAKAKRDNAGNRMSRDAKSAIITEFLNSDVTYVDAVELRWSKPTKPAQVVNALNTIIREDGLSELVYALVTEGGATLVSFANDPDES